MMSHRSLGAQIQEVERELALRERVYGRETNQKKRSENDEHMTRMISVLHTLQWLQTNEAKIRKGLNPLVSGAGEPIDASSGSG